MSATFVHLRLHTEFSLVDGLVRGKPLILGSLLCAETRMAGEFNQQVQHSGNEL